jgi:hypothetical protein
MSVLHSVAELLSTVGDTYKAIDVRCVGIREADSWINVMAVVRLTYEEAESARARITKLSQRFPPVQTESLRINTEVRPFSEWPEFCAEVETYGVLRVGNHQFKLRQRPNLRAASGYFQPGYSEIRSFDGRTWPELRIKFDPGGLNPLAEGRFNKEVHLLGHADVFEAVNGLCELSVSVRNQGNDFSLCIPVFATISSIRVKTVEKTIDVDIERHGGFPDLKAVVCLRGQTTLVDEPFREQITISTFKSEGEGQIVSAKGSVQFENLSVDNDWLQVRLLHPLVGEVKRDENYARMFVPAAERNILLEALRLFCEDAELDNLLIRAYDAKAPRLNESAGFELHVAWLLGMFGFATAVLGHYEHIVAPHTRVRRATVDVLAASQQNRILLAVACTLNAPKAEDFGTLRYARDILAREVFAETGVRVVPVLFTSATGCPTYDKAEGSFDSVPIMDADQVQKALNLLRAGQEHSFLNFLANPTFGRLA